MIRFIARRLVGVVAVLFAISVAVFLLFNVIPGGDPALRLAGRHPTPQNIANIRADWGFDRPLPVQYVDMLRHLVIDRDIISYQDQTPVIPTIVRGIPRTLSLGIGAAIIWLVVGVLLGIVSGLHEGRLVDRLVSVIALTGISIPIFWLGSVLLYLLTYRFRSFPLFSWIPIGGYASWSHPIEWAKHLILPWLVLSTTSIGFYSRIVRASLLNARSADHVRTARAIGLGPVTVLVRHVLRTSLIPVVTLFGLDFAATIGGTVILIETVFGIGGVGQYAQQSVAHLDLPPLMAITLYGAALVVVTSAVVDIAYAWLDPRIRLA